MTDSDHKRTDTLHVVDIGNSSVKVGTLPWPDSSSPLQTTSVSAEAGDFEPIAQAVAQFAADTPWFLASVSRPTSQRLADWIHARFPVAEVRELRNSDCPIEIDVEQPNRVGIDRILGAVAANDLRPPGHPAVVVDAGSAITVDAVSKDGTFLGGVIMAGFSMRTSALANNTDLLPLIRATGADESPSVIGRSTEDAIRSGIFWGTIGSIREVIARMQTEIGDAAVFVTGGDMVRMTGHLKDQARFEPHLVLSGIAMVARNTRDSA